MSMANTGASKNASRARDGEPPAGSRGGRDTTAGDVEQRLLDTEEAMLRLLSDRKAAREMVSQHRVHYQTALKWCRMVRERWKADADARVGTDREVLRQQHIQRIAKIADDADGPDGSLKVRLAAAERLAQLDGFLTNKVEVTGKDGGPLEVLQKMSDAQLEEIVRRSAQGGAGG